jgi:outer membrane biogenesis lipoprotein LolB
MRNMSRWTLVVAGFLLTACSSTEWVHPNKPSSEYTSDYNKCETAATRDPKLQQANQVLLTNATERCIQSEGWRLIEQ